MPLVRLTEKQLAANRANAQKSTGPRTPEGKAHSAQNACKHHLYARTHIIPPVWHERIVDKVLAATAELAADQRRRELHARYVYLELWSSELESLADAYFDHTLALCGYDFRRACHQWRVKTPLSHAIHKRRRHITVQIYKAERDINRYERSRLQQSHTPALQYQQPRTLAAAAGAGPAPQQISFSAERTPNLHITSGIQNAPQLRSPQPLHDRRVPASITLQVNGAPRSATAPDGIVLLEFLRDHLHLTGAKYGCGEGACGACTVLIDGRPVSSCTVSAASVQGRQITTIEGLAANDKLHPVQQAFLDAEAFQCGFCTPAMILAAAALLKESPNPSAALIREKLEDHLCRCGTYPRIVEAVRLAAKLGAPNA